MANVWGNNIKISIFGESHGEGIGVVIDGIPTGVVLDMGEIRREMSRRAPGKDKMSTPRKEADEVEILSGVFEGKSCGTPICGMIRNTNTKSKDYTPYLLRPSHADYTGFVKYGDFGDYRGGGHFSGRLTAPLVFAGAIAKQVLALRGITIGAHIKQIGEIEDIFFDKVNMDKDLLNHLTNTDFAVIDEQVGNKMKEVIENARLNSDSVGGVIECAAVGVPVGQGNPFFYSVESVISSMMFSVPAVKGIEFGAGFDFAGKTGGDANDEFYVEDGRIKTYTNNAGGINGGITNGMPLVFSVAIRPTPSIAKKQRTVDIEKMENATIEIHGRHDPCIVHRAVSVIEAACAISILEVLE